MHRQQVPRIAADDDFAASSKRERQIFVILWVAAFADAVARLDPFGGEDHNVENAPTTLDRDEPIEFWTEDDLSILILDLLRQDEAVRISDRAGALAPVCCRP